VFLKASIFPGVLKPSECNGRFTLRNTPQVGRERVSVDDDDELE
jgi:hypothetical protein